MQLTEVYQKLGEDAFPLETLRGAGYKLRTPATPARDGQGDEED